MAKMTRGQECFTQEYCTDCPNRKVCTIRPTFYSDEAYNAWKEDTIKKFNIVTSLQGVPPFIAQMGKEMALSMMDKRRAEERRLHATYVKD